MAPPPLFIAVAGNIAAGKTTLVARLAEALAVEAHVEQPAGNPWFNRAGTHPARWSLHVEMAFLIHSLRACTAILDAGRRGVIERLPDEHLDVFARFRHERGWLDHDELALLRAAGRSRHEERAVPDVLVYLEAPLQELVARIGARGRPTETALRPEVLASLGALYESFRSAWKASPIIAVDTVALDVRNEDGLSEILRMINETR